MRGKFALKHSLDDFDKFEDSLRFEGFLDMLLKQNTMLK